MSTKSIVVHPRFALAATVMVREANGAAVLAQLRNISLSGCYLETPRQIPDHTRVRVALHIFMRMFGALYGGAMPAVWAYNSPTAPRWKTGNGWSLSLGNCKVRSRALLPSQVVSHSFAAKFLALAQMASLRDCMQTKALPL